MSIEILSSAPNKKRYKRFIEGTVAAVKVNFSTLTIEKRGLPFQPTKVSLSRGNSLSFTGMSGAQFQTTVVFADGNGAPISQTDSGGTLTITYALTLYSDGFLLTITTSNTIYALPTQADFSYLATA